MNEKTEVHFFAFKVLFVVFIHISVKRKNNNIQFLKDAYGIANSVDPALFAFLAAQTFPNTKDHYCNEKFENVE